MKKNAAPDLPAAPPGGASRRGGFWGDVADRSWPVLRRVMVLHTFAYRATNGRIGHRLPGVPAPILLLDHVGAKSGVNEPRRSAEQALSGSFDGRVVWLKAGEPAPLEV